MKKKIQILTKAEEAGILRLMKNGKQNGLYKTGSFSSQIIWGDKHFYFNHENNPKEFYSGLFIFKMVKNDIEKFFKDVEDIKAKRSLPVNWVVKEELEEDRAITGTDLNHAYWRIAYNLGYIRINTYKKGLDLKKKDLRLAALSSLGADKEFKVIRNGTITDNLKKVDGNKKYRAIYNNIRNTCFYHMQQAAKMLGDDFIAYKTDCIYYYDSLQNRKKVQSYLKEQQFSYKQLVEVV